MDNDSRSDPGERLEEVVERFEAAHRRGERPAIDAYLAECEAAKNGGSG